MKIKINAYTTSRVLNALSIAYTKKGVYQTSKYCDEWFHTTANIRTKTAKKLGEKLIENIEAGFHKGDIDQLKTARYSNGLKCFEIS